MLIRIIAKNMIGGKGFDIIEKMLDRGIGKATTTEVATLKVEMWKLSKDEQEKIDDLLWANFDSKTDIMRHEKHGVEADK